MFLAKYIDKKLPYKSIKSYVQSFLFFGAPVGLIAVEITKIIVYGGFSAYKEKFDINAIFFTLFLDIVISLPFIINYIKHKRRYKKILQKLDDKEEQKPKDKKHYVRALYNYKDVFIKGEIYELEPNWGWIRPLKNGYNIIKNNSYSTYKLEDYINKFELEDIKEERRKKLKKLKRIL